MVFQPNSKYLHIGISFQWQPTCVDFKNMAERFPECVNAVYFNSVAMSTFRSEIVTIPFRLWLYYLLFSPRKWTMSRQDSTIHEWNWRLCERTRAYVRVNCQILTGANRNIEWFPVYSLRSCFVENMAERFHEWAWMLFTWIPWLCLAEAARDIKDNFEISLDVVFMPNIPLETMLLPIPITRQSFCILF